MIGTRQPTALGDGVAGSVAARRKRREAHSEAPRSALGRCGVLVLVLAGCSEDSLEDLSAFVELAPPDRMQETVVMEDSPDAVPATAKVVTRNPFEPTARSTSGIAHADGPDPSRMPQPLEQHPVGRLQMVGTLAGGGTHYALVRDPNGRTHAAAAGDYLGRDHGRIVTIHGDRVEFIELVADGSGWRRRPRSLAMETDDPTSQDAGEP